MMGRRVGARMRALPFLFFPVLVVSCGGDGGDPHSPGAGAQSAGAGGAGPVEPWFEEAAQEAGLGFVHDLGSERRFWIPETIVGGVALFDMDGDGDLDAYCVQSGAMTDDGQPVREKGNQLFENDGSGRFTDVTEKAGVGDTGYGVGVTVGDANGDGHQDLYVTNIGANTLYLGRGDGTFEDATKTSRTGDPGFGASASFLDVDGDGDLDLYVVNYLRWSAAIERTCASEYGTGVYCSPNSYEAPARDTLYRNRGDGVFDDVSDVAGLGKAFGNGLGVVWGEIDGKPGLEIYVANDGGPNQLWRPRSGGRLEDGALLSGCAVNGNGAAEAGMGLVLADLTGDGRLDLFSTHVNQESHTLYQGGAGGFKDATTRTKLASPTVRKTGFGAGAHDFDHDGFIDLFIAGGRVRAFTPTEDALRPFAESDQLFAGSGKGPFREVPNAGLRAPLTTVGHGAAFGDIDGDGDVDVLVLDAGGPLRLYRNVAPKAEGAWVRFDVRDGPGRQALGATVEVQTPAGAQVRCVQVTYSYCSANDPAVHFGLGSAQDVSGVTVRWLDGSEETFEGPFPPASTHVLSQGSGR